MANIFYQNQSLILARGDHFGSQNRSSRINFGSKSGPGGPVLAGFSAKISLARPILGETDFGLTDQLTSNTYFVYIVTMYQPVSPLVCGYILHMHNAVSSLCKNLAITCM